MKTYLYLQLKRAARLLPFVLAVALVLFGALLAVFRTVMQKAASDEAQDAMLVRVAVTGDTDYKYFDLWLSAIQNFDTSRYAIEIVKTEEEQAKRELEAGTLAAYVVLPDDFIEEALCGRIKTITYVTTTGAVDAMSLFKEEVTEVISRIVAESQKGVYGIGEALDDNGHSDISGEKLNDLNLKYIDLILDRSLLYQTQTVEAVGEDIPLQTYLFSGIAVLMVFLTALPYALLYVKRDVALHQTLAARGYASTWQLLCEYAAYAVTVFGLFFLVLSVLAPFTDVQLSGIPGGSRLLLFAAQLLPVVVTVTAFGFMIFELAGNVVSGVLLYFLLSLGLCYIGGCLYPLYAFPESVQQTAVYLPAALARSYLSDCLGGAVTAAPVIGMLAYAVGFIAVAAFVRHRRVIGKWGCAA